MTYMSLEEELNSTIRRLDLLNKSVDTLPTPAQLEQLAALNKRISDLGGDTSALHDDAGVDSAPMMGFTGGTPAGLPPAQPGDTDTSPPPEHVPPRGSGPDLTAPIHTAPPVPGETVFLPLTGAEQYDNIIREADKALVRVNDAAFDLEPDDLWNPESAHLGGADGPTNISSLSSVTSDMGDITERTKTMFSDLGDTLDAEPEGTWPDRFREMYKPTLESANSGVEDNGPVSNAVSRTADAGRHVNDAFSSFHGAIASARHAIAGLYGTDEFGNPYLDTSRTLAMDPNIADPAVDAVLALDATNAELATAIDPWSISTRISPDSSEPLSSGGSGAAPFVASAPSAGGSTVGSTGGLGGGSSDEPAGADSALDTLFGAPAQSPMPPMGGMPQMPPVPQMPTFPDIPVPPIGDDKLAAPGDTVLSADDHAPSEGKPHAPTPPAETARASTPDSTAATSAVMQNAIPRPGDPVRPGALGADGKLLDKDGDGRMDRDALAPTRENADPDGDGFRDKFKMALDVNGESVDVTCDDPRLAEMMTRLAEGDSGNPVGILDAARDSGLDLEDYGQKIDTLALKPGDVVTGTDTGMYLGDGRVLTESGDLKNLVDVMDYRVSDPEVYRLGVPELPSSEEVVPEVPAPAETATTQPEPVPTPAPEAAAQPEQAPTPEPDTRSAAAQASAPSTDDALAAMLSGNVDTGIKDVPYQGYAMGGADESAPSETGIKDVQYQGYAMGGPDSPEK